jgi:hypothetical protein
MVDRIYLADVFGWDTEWTAKVAISQLRNDFFISSSKCPKAQLIKNGSIRWQPNLLKAVGYIPGLNIVAGIMAMALAENEHTLRPNDHKKWWMIRGIAMILTGPLLLIVDLIKFIFDVQIVLKYNKEHKDIIKKFDTLHTHTNPPWPMHPVSCLPPEIKHI